MLVKCCVMLGEQPPITSIMRHRYGISCCYRPRELIHSISGVRKQEEPITTGFGQAPMVPSCRAFGVCPGGAVISPQTPRRVPDCRNNVLIISCSFRNFATCGILHETQCPRSSG